MGYRTIANQCGSENQITFSLRCSFSECDKTYTKFN